MLKVLLVVIILYLFRHELRWFGPYWHVLVAMGVGTAMGVLYARFLGKFGILEQVGKMTGLGTKGFAVVVVGFCVIASAWTLGPMIIALFPTDRGRE